MSAGLKVHDEISREVEAHLHVAGHRVVHGRLVGDDDHALAALRAVVAGAGRVHAAATATAAEDAALATLAWGSGVGPAGAAATAARPFGEA